MRFPIELLATALPTALAAGASSSSSKTSGSFNILQYNVAGLPSFINNNNIFGGKSHAASTISQKFSEYAFDVIHVQEDFHYHSNLYSNSHHPYKTKTSGDVPFGSGLNTLSNFEWTEFRRVNWDRCGFNSGDCFTAKGFTFMRVRIATGVEVDFYNVHADAGDFRGDYSARSDNLQQLADYIHEHSAGRAVLVVGDLNTLYSREGSLQSLAAQAGMTDAWVQTQYDGVVPEGLLECPVPAHDSCETLDSVLYRSGTDVRLNAIKFEYVTDMFMQEGGHLLSDHNPVLVDFEWEVSVKELR